MKKPQAKPKRAGGPNTQKGKLVSSQNALKTGLTTKQLLNEQEFARFNQLKTDLNNYYSGTNPLIQLQIEKITRMQIQLERIQNAIDASFRTSEQNSTSKAHKKKSSEPNLQLLRTELKILLQLIDIGILNKIQNEFFSKIFTDLVNENAKEADAEEWSEGVQSISSQTLLGAYLLVEAKNFHQSPKDYIQEKLKAITNARSRKEMYEDIDLELLAKAIDLKNSKSTAESIETDNYYERKQLESWFEIEMSKVPEYIRQIKNSIEQKNNPFQIIMPDYDNLDRLMRYQTTLTRQLSTAMGELIILAK